jgi:hypothetical protein
LKIEELKLTIESKSREVVVEFEESLKAYKSFTGSSKKVQESLSRQVYEPIRRGFGSIRNLETLQTMVDLIHQSIRYESGILTAQHKAMMSQARINRLLWAENYEGIGPHSEDSD